MRSLATAISGKTGKPDRLDSAPDMSIDADSRGNGEIIEPRAPASLDELERLLREHSLELARAPLLKVYIAQREVRWIIKITSNLSRFSKTRGRELRRFSVNFPSAAQRRHAEASSG